MSSRDIVDLKALTAEYADQFAKEGKRAIKGKNKAREKALKSKDPFDKPSPGLIKRLAAEARNDAKRRHFQDDGSGPSDEQRRRIMEDKAAKYDAIRRGDLSGLTKKEIAEAALDLENLTEWSGSDDDDDDDDEEDDEYNAKDELVEYIDDLGRTRRGTRAEARENGVRDQADQNNAQPDNSAYAEVLQSNVIRGDQNFFPVYEPDADALRQKYIQAEEEARQPHYDASREVRAKAAGQYQFSLDEETRARQLSDLKAQRRETERAQAEASERRMSQAQEQRKRKLDERLVMLEEKRIKMFGGKENLARLRAEKETEDLFAEVEKGLAG